MTQRSRRSSKDQDDPWVFPMLEAIGQHPDLWNLSNPKYKLKHTARKDAWIKVADYVKEATGIEKTAEILSKRWDTIFRAYKTYKKTQPTGSEGGQRKARKYEAALAFLETRPVHRRTTTNLEPVADEDDEILINLGDDPPAGTQDTEGEGDEDDVPLAAAIKRPRRSGSRNSGNDSDERIISLLERAVAQNTSTESTKYEEYGKIVVRILNALPRRSQPRQQAMADLAAWIARYDDEYGGESDDNQDVGDQRP